MLGLLWLGVAAPAAIAQGDTIAPPGNSAVQEYLETVPTAGGDKVVSGAPRARVLSKSARARLERLGADGRATAALAEATAPAVTALGARSNSRKVGASAVARASGGASVIAATAQAFSGSGGMGLLLPAILVAALAGALGVAVMRRHPPADR